MVRIDEEAEEARHRRFAGGQPIVILSEDVKQKGRGHLSIPSLTARPSLLSAIFEEGECATLAVFVA
jgi:hypothetical protein